ncbi:hypothetical protein B0H10DRAFT_968493 [Mycena sp. CBHHK59/15]|nr:hypothetical protein B0H10DRAFT_968493 [Mycena sp. CBHHK59/15]
MEPALAPLLDTALLDAFRSHYNHFQTSVTAIIQNCTDTVVVARLGDDLDEYIWLVQEAYLMQQSSPHSRQVLLQCRMTSDWNTGMLSMPPITVNQ